MFYQQQNLGRRFGAGKMHLPPPCSLGCCPFSAVALLLLTYCFMYLTLFLGVLCWSLLWYSLLCVLYSFYISLRRKRELADLLLLSFRCLVTVNVLWLFLTLRWLGLLCVIVVFPDRTHLLFVSVVDFTSIRTYSPKTNKLRNINTIHLRQRSEKHLHKEIGNFKFKVLSLIINFR